MADWNTRFFQAIQSVNVPQIQALLAEPGADVNARNVQGLTGLMEAMFREPDDAATLVGVLLTAGADPNLQAPPRTRTALMTAVNNNYVAAIRLFMDHPLTNPNVQDWVGNTALHISVANRRARSFRELLADRPAGVQPLNVNVQNNTGHTALMIAVVQDMLEEILKLLQVGADRNLRNARDQTARDLANEVRLNDIVPLLDAPPDQVEAVYNQILAARRGAAPVALAPPPMPQIRAAPVAQGELPRQQVDERIVPSELWNKPFEGIFEDDFSLLQGILEDPVNNTLCPLCLGHVYREAGCLYMKHDCRLLEIEQPGRENIVQPSETIYHQRLFNLYNIGGQIYWCGACGRICGGQERGVTGHQHYHLGAHQDTTRPELHSSGGQFFDVRKGGDVLCLQSGGGGFDEKIKRVNRLLKWAAELQSEVGKMTRKEAMYQLIEETWNAALFRDPDLERTKAEKTFSIPFSAFPRRAAAVAPEREEEAKEPEDIPKPADELANVPELVAPPEGQEFLLDAEGNPRMDPVTLDDMTEGIRFTHKRRDGTVYRHTDDELISRGGLTQWIQQTAPGTAKFGRCFLEECDARLWPVDVEPYISADLLATYKRNFNRTMRGAVGGAKKRFGITYEVENAECALPPKKDRKGGKTYRRHFKTGKRNTYRRRR